MRLLLCLLPLLWCCRGLQAQEEAASFVPKPLVQLTDRALSPLGAKALSLHRETWQHAETANFAYHYHSEALARAAAVESEFYYRVIASELGRDTTQWERKSHLFIFENEEDWHRFQAVGGLEPWTGGIHHQGELFILRNAQQRFKGNSLAHEVTHLIVFRFFGAGVPLWLHEGLAEYTATRWYASFMRARGYGARPHSTSVAPERYLPLAQLTGALGYPAEETAVTTFYAESERLVRFLAATDKRKFAGLLEAMGKGARFETALDRNFGTHFLNLEALEKQFQPYAAKDYVDPSP